MRRVAVIAIAWMVPVLVHAQDVRLESVLDRETANTVAHLIDSARALRLPTDGLLGVALEGATRHASPSRIVEAVRSYVVALSAARRTLGESSSDAEIAAGAGAVLSGVSPGQLGALRAVRTRRPLTVPLVVLADLIARRVPVDTAARAVALSVAAGATDDDLSALRRYIEQDIRAGASPGAAAISRLGAVPGITPSQLRNLWSADHRIPPS
jgi:hypothetical protein